MNVCYNFALALSVKFLTVRILHDTLHMAIAAYHYTEPCNISIACRN